MAIGAIDLGQPGARDGASELALLGEGEEAVALDAEDQGGLLDLGQGLADAGGAVA